MVGVKGRLLAHLGEILGTYAVTLFAYALMSNHLHPA